MSCEKEIKEEQLEQVVGGNNGFVPNMFYCVVYYVSNGTNKSKIVGPCVSESVAKVAGENEASKRQKAGCNGITYTTKYHADNGTWTTCKNYVYSSNPFA